MGTISKKIATWLLVHWLILARFVRGQSLPVLTEEGWVAYLNPLSPVYTTKCPDGTILFEAIRTLCRVCVILDGKDSSWCMVATAKTGFAQTSYGPLATFDLNAAAKFLHRHDPDWS